MANTKAIALSNVYTVMLAVALAAVIACAAYVAIRASLNYETIFQIVTP
jgi:hypothetical protein